MEERERERERDRELTHFFLFLTKTSFGLSRCSGFFLLLRSLARSSFSIVLYRWTSVCSTHCVVLIPVESEREREREKLKRAHSLHVFLVDVSLALFLLAQEREKKEKKKKQKQKKQCDIERFDDNKKIRRESRLRTVRDAFRPTAVVASLLVLADVGEKESERERERQRNLMI